MSPLLQLLAAATGPTSIPPEYLVGGGGILGTIMFLAKVLADYLKDWRRGRNVDSEDARASKYYSETMATLAEMAEADKKHQAVTEEVHKVTVAFDRDGQPVPRGCGQGGCEAIEAIGE